MNIFSKISGSSNKPMEQKVLNPVYNPTRSTGLLNKPTEQKVVNPIYKKPHSLDSLTVSKTEEKTANQRKATQPLHRSSEVVKLGKYATLRAKPAVRKPRSTTGAGELKMIDNSLYRLNLEAKGVKRDDQKPHSSRSRNVINLSPLSQGASKNVESELRLFQRAGLWRLSFKLGEKQESPIDLKGNLSPDDFDRLVSARSDNLKECAQHLYKILPKDDRLVFIKNLIEAELRKIQNKTDSSETQGSLLRESSLALYMMVEHIETLSSLAIDHIVGQLFKDLDSITSKKSPEGAGTARSFQLLFLVDGVLNRAKLATDIYTHKSVKKMFKELAVLCNGKFPESPNLSDQQIGGIYFLRILNSKIALSSTNRKFNNDENQKQRYADVSKLISKILQSTVSQATAGDSGKEELNKIPDDLMFAFRGKGFEERKNKVCDVIRNLKTLDE